MTDFLATLPKLPSLGFAKNAFAPVYWTGDERVDSGLTASFRDADQSMDVARRAPKPSQAILERRSVQRLDPEDPETYQKLLPTIERVKETSSSWSTFLQGLGRVLEQIGQELFLASDLAQGQFPVVGGGPAPVAPVEFGDRADGQAHPGENHQPQAVHGRFDGELPNRRQHPISH